MKYMIEVIEGIHKSGLNVFSPINLPKYTLEEK